MVGMGEGEGGVQELLYAKGGHATFLLSLYMYPPFPFLLILLLC